MSEPISTEEAIQIELEGYGKVLWPIYNRVIPTIIYAEQVHSMGHLRKFDEFNPQAPSYRYSYHPFKKCWNLD